MYLKAPVKRYSTVDLYLIAPVEEWRESSLPIIVRLSLSWTTYSGLSSIDKEESRGPGFESRPEHLLNFNKCALLSLFLHK